MNYYLFFEHCDGNHFIVEAENYFQAETIANDEFGNAEIEFVEEISYEEAEMLGYDTF